MSNDDLSALIFAVVYAGYLVFWVARALRSPGKKRPRH